jgi:hypothetical protein
VIGADRSKQMIVEFPDPACVGATPVMKTMSRKDTGCVIDVRADDPELASYLRIEERELEADGLD